MSDTNGPPRTVVDDYRYVGSCGIMNVQAASLIIGILEAACILIAIPHLAFESGTDLDIKLIFWVFTALVTICLFVGIRKERCCLLVPFLVSSVIQSIICFFALLASLIAFVNSSEILEKFTDEMIRELEVANTSDASYKQKALYLALLYLILLALKVWSFLIINKCRCCFRDQAECRPVVMKYTCQVPDEENQTNNAEQTELCRRQHLKSYLVY